MKFMSSFQCLMGGNPVQFQNPSSITASPSQSISRVLLDKDDDQRDSCNVTKKKNRMKKLKRKKKKKDGKVIKVFKADGEIKVYQKPIKVSEVMTDEHMVCRSDSFYIGQKIPPLSQHDRLQPGHTYFLLPAHLFHSVLSFVTIASITAASSSSKKQQQQQQQDYIDDDDSSSNANQMKMKAAFLKKAAASSCSPFDIQKTPSGTLRIRVSEMFISQLMMEQAAAVAKQDGEEETGLIDHLLLCTTPQLHREYKQLVVGSRRGWKPKLEMIKETPSPKGKRKVKMLLTASINRMKKKIKKNKNLSVPQTQSSLLSSSSAAAAAVAAASTSSPKKKKKKTNKQTSIASKTTR